jgi:putative ABC transport system permease protein
MGVPPSMVNQLVSANLRHRPVRTILSIIAIGVEVMLILTLVGLSEGTLEETARRTKGVGADILIRPPGSSVISMSAAPMTESLLPFFQKQPHVVLATGTVSQGIGGIDSVTGIDLEKFNALSGGFRYLEGGPFRGSDDLIVDERYASQNKVGVGSKVKLLNRDWNVVGVIESGKLARLMIPIKLLQEYTGNTGKVSVIYLKLDDPKQTGNVVKSLKAQVPDYQIYSVEEFTSLFSIDNIPALKPFINVVIVISVIVGFLVVALSMYTAVLERTREIGILKSLGATPAFILGLLLRETAVLAIAGSLLGILFSFGTRWLVLRYGGATLVSVITPMWWPYTTAIAMVGALLGTLYPGWMAVKQDALEALSYD